MCSSPQRWPSLPDGPGSGWWRVLPGPGRSDHWAHTSLHTRGCFQYLQCHASEPHELHAHTQPDPVACSDSAVSSSSVIRNWAHRSLVFTSVQSVEIQNILLPAIELSPADSLRSPLCWNRISQYWFLSWFLPAFCWSTSSCRFLGRNAREINLGDNTCL